MDNFTAQTQAMDAQLDEMVRAMLRLQPSREAVTATDPEEQVKVTIAPGGSVAAIEVAARWSERIEPENLGTTVLTTIAEAQLAASGLSEDAGEPTDAEVAARREEITRHAEAVLEAPVPEADLQARIDHIPVLFDQLDAAISKLNEKVTQMAPPVSMAEAEELGLTDVKEGIRYASENEMVALTVNRGTVVDLTIHQRWAESRSGIAITECFDQIIAQMTDQPIR